MRRQIRGLTSADTSAALAIPGGLLLTQVRGVRFHWHAQKPYYEIRFHVLEPKMCVGRSITGRLHCSRKALWKLSWFLRDFGYDLELLGRDEIDEKSLVGLQGVIKIGHVVRNGISLLNLEGFAPSAQWEELATTWRPSPVDREAQP